MRQLLNRLFENQTLSREEARQTLCDIAEQKYNPSQVSSFLTIFCMRSLTVEELEGFRQAMLELCRPIDLSEFNAVDLCGTGGDGKDTFNISTLSAFVVAGSGVKVAKHGNNGVSSLCGSSNVLQHLGIQFTNDQAQLKRNIDRAGICYLHAPLFHPAMKNIAPIRRELGVRTFFNVLGPLVNPSRPRNQLAGVFSLELARLYAYLFQRRKTHYTIVHSLDGYDEISLTGRFKVISMAGEQILHPEEIQLEPTLPEQIKGGKDIASSAAIFLKILEGEGSEAQERVIFANAGFAIHCAKPEQSLQDSIAAAKESLHSGKALKAYQTLLKTQGS